MHTHDNGILGKVKSALVGDLSAYDRYAFQNGISSTSRRKAQRASSFGRPYSLQDLPQKRQTTESRAMKAVSSVWKTVRSIGEYDAARTR